jgi:hypothetical protein
MLNLSVFPGSRFPGVLHYEKNLSDTNLEEIETDTNTSRYGYRQQYRDPSGTQRLDLSVERSHRSSSSDGDDLSQLLKFDFSKSYKYQKINVSSESNTRRNRQQNTRSRDSDLVARHTVSRFKGLSVESVMSLVDVEDKNGDSSREIQANQLSSFGTWRSERLNSLLVSGSLRMASLTNREIDVSNVELDSLAAKLAVNFDVAENVRFKGGLNASTNKNSVDRTRFVSESASLSYNPTDFELGKTRYSYGVSTAFSNRATDGDSEQRYSASFTHSLNRTLTLSENSSMWLSFDESFGTSHPTDEEKAQRITHAVNANWRGGTSKGVSMLRLTLNDSRSFGKEETAFQMANLQFNKEASIGRDRSVNGNMTIQASRQEMEGNTTLDVIANGIIGYRQRYLFNIPRFAMSLDLELVSHGLTPDKYTRVKKDTAADDEGRLRTQFLYSIGKISLSLTSLIVYRDGEWDRAIQLQLNRSMGSRSSL